MASRIATVGTFDGLHHGHRAIIDRLLQRAEATGLQPTVFTFTSHPLATIAPQRCPATVMAREEVESNLKALGIESVIMLDFNAGLAAYTAREFLAMLRRRYDVRELVMGFDNTFGSDRLTRHDDYTEAAHAEEMEISFVNPVTTPDGLKISSSLLRHALRDGDMERARQCTGTYPSITGTVEYGKRNGHKIGFPTLNINPKHPLPLCEGVYIASMNYNNRIYHGLLNVGNNPTFGNENKLTYELHIPGHDLGDMYGETVNVSIMKYLRGEKKFANIDELTAAIKANINEMKSYFLSSSII